MDSKKTYYKNQLWKKKYKKKACGSIAPKSTKPTANKVSEENDEDQFDSVPKQVLPLNGWFPEDDDDDSSSLSDDDFQAIVASLNLLKPKDSSTGKNWFDQELDNVQLNSQVSHLKINDQSEQNINAVPKQESIVKNEDKMKSKLDKVSNEDEDLDYLLSLKEPVQTSIGPIFTTQKLSQDRKINSVGVSTSENKDIKSIDLEKWLDTVLDD